MTDTGALSCAIHGPIDARVQPGNGPGGLTCPVMARRTVGEFDEYAACGLPLTPEQAS